MICSTRVWEFKALPSSSESSKSMSSSLSESDSMSRSTLVLVFCTEGGGLCSSFKFSPKLLLETGDDFVIGGDTFGLSIISSRPKQRRFSEVLTLNICPNKIYFTTDTLPYSYFSSCLRSQCCVEAVAEE